VIALNNKIFFAGGMKSDRTFSDKMDTYDVLSESWSTTSLPGTPRAIMGATTANNKLFFCGGYTEYTNYTGWGEVLGKPVKDIDIYNVPNGTWTADAMQVAKTGFATYSYNDKLYLAGGFIDFNRDNFFETLDCTVEIKNVNSPGNLLNCLFQANTFYACDVVEKNDQLFFIGDQYTNTVSGKIDIYNAQTGNWKIGLLPSNLTFDSYTTSVASSDNQIYVVYHDKLYTMNF
jgi:hypothetical protein